MSRKEIVTIIIKHTKNLIKDDAEKFISISKYAVKKRKEIILAPQDKGQKSFYILKGTVRGFIFNEKGVEKNIFLRTEGFFGGDIEKMFYNKEPKYTFEALEETHLLFFDFKELEALVLSDKVYTGWYISVLKEILARLNYRVETLVSMSAKERYMDLLKMNPKFLQKTYSKFVANFLGITPVTLSRIIKEIKAKNQA